MEVKLDKRYPLDVEPARAWMVLQDVRAVAGCMPGAAITEQVDDTHYKGTVKVKVGPANAAFGGDIEVLALDAAAMKLQLLGKGADRSGSSASMNLTAHVEAGDTAATSVLVGEAAVIVNGKFAQFGGRMMSQVSDMLLAQFADNFRAAAAALPAPQAAAAPAASATTPVPVRELNALGLAWGLVKHWFAGMFGRRT
jgi:carbon monoxide dehydrogenase subunit G